MYKVLNSSSLQVFHACRSTSYYEHGSAVKILECRNSILSILVITRTNDHDVGLCLQSCVNSLFYGLKAKVVNHFIAGTSKEVARELSTSLTHGKITNGEHEGYGHLLLLGLYAKVFEVGSQARTLDGFEWRILTLTTLVAATATS